MVGEITMDIGGLSASFSLEKLGLLGLEDWGTEVSQIRQRTGIYLPRDTTVVGRSEHRHRLIDPGKPWQNGSNESVKSRQWDDVE